MWSERPQPIAQLGLVGEAAREGREARIAGEVGVALVIVVIDPSREPLAELKARLADRVKAIEDLQHRVQVQREAAVLLAQRIEVLSTKSWRDAQAAAEALRADVPAWQAQAQALAKAQHGQQQDLDPALGRRHLQAREVDHQQVVQGQVVLIHWESHWGWMGYRVKNWRTSASVISGCSSGRKCP